MLLEDSGSTELPSGNQTWRLTTTIVNRKTSTNGWCSFNLNIHVCLSDSTDWFTKTLHFGNFPEQGDQLRSGSQSSCSAAALSVGCQGFQPAAGLDGEDMRKKDIQNWRFLQVSFILPYFQLFQAWPQCTSVFFPLCFFCFVSKWSQFVRQRSTTDFNLWTRLQWPFDVFFNVTACCNPRFQLCPLSTISNSLATRINSSGSPADLQLDLGKFNTWPMPCRWSHKPRGQEHPERHRFLCQLRLGIFAQVLQEEVQADAKDRGTQATFKDVEEKILDLNSPLRVPTPLKGIGLSMAEWLKSWISTIDRLTIGAGSHQR